MLPYIMLVLLGIGLIITIGCLVLAIAAFRGAVRTQTPMLALAGVCILLWLAVPGSFLIALSTGTNTSAAAAILLGLGVFGFLSCSMVAHKQLHTRGLRVRDVFLFRL